MKSSSLQLASIELTSIEHPEMQSLDQGDMDSSSRPLIIERSELQGKGQRVIYGGITLGFWLLWVYICLPLVSLLAWALGFNLLYTQMVLYGGYDGLLRVLGLYLLIIAILGGSLLLWAFYNYFRFRGVERRRASQVVNIDRQCARLGLKPAHLMQWQMSKRLVVHHGSRCNIIGVETKYKSWLNEELLMKKQRLMHEQERECVARTGMHHS